MVVTNRADLGERVRLLRSHGMTTLTWDRHKGHAGSYDVVNPGTTTASTSCMQRLARVQLKKLERNNQRRRELLACYREAVQSLSGWTMPFAASIQHSSGHLMVVVAPDPHVRQKAVQALRDFGIQSSMHYPCVADFTGFTGSSEQSLELTKQFTRRAITLPLFPTLHADWINEIVEVLRVV